ncbi:MAG: hypothetical protein FD149_2218 [Rhodospirillaceae bacterium]|nr:MAG: hypothetical protein FD149_2218 [Rhodospirillaceae bacterium]
MHQSLSHHGERKKQGGEKMFDVLRYFMEAGKANLTAIVASHAAAIRGVHVLTWACFSLARRNIETAHLASRAMLACRTPVETTLLHSRLARETFSRFLVERNQMAEMISSIVRQTLTPIGLRCQSQPFFPLYR